MKYVVTVQDLDEPLRVVTRVVEAATPHAAQEKALREVFRGETQWARGRALYPTPLLDPDVEVRDAG